MQIKCSHLNHQTWHHWNRRWDCSSFNSNPSSHLVQITPSLGGDEPSTATQRPISKLPQPEKVVSKRRGYSNSNTPWDRHQWCPSSAAAAGCCVKWHHCSCRSVVDGSHSSGGHRKSSGNHPHQCLASGRSSLQWMLQEKKNKNLIEVQNLDIEVYNTSKSFWQTNKIPYQPWCSTSQGHKEGAPWTSQSSQCQPTQGAPSNRRQRILIRNYT